MMLAPMPQLSAVSVQMRDGYPGVLQTLAKMRQLVKQCKTNPEIRQAATQAIFLTPEKNQLHEVDAIFRVVRDGIRYVRDVHDVETLSTPMITLAGRLGDCDDQVMLLASMLESVGYPTRFVIEGYHDPRQYEHVYLQVWVYDQWIAMDPTEPYPLGWSPPNPVCQQVESV